MNLFPHGSTTEPETFGEYRTSGGYESSHRNLSSSEILGEIAASGLRGRGGAGFSVARKWTIASETPADRRYVICNGGEDEPGSSKDRVLLECRPHLVLEGILLACRAVGASEAIIYINEHYERAIQRVEQAIDECDADFPVRIHRAPAAYVAGEDSACIEVIEGKPPLPRQKPPYPAVVGLFGKPTVVNNVETLANVPLIVRNGAQWFRRHGTPEEPGTMLFCLGEEMNRPGVYELPFGSSMRELYERLGGGLRSGRALKAILPGGPSCSFLRSEHIDVRLDSGSLRSAGASLGCGVMRFYPEGACMVESALEISQFFERESCGQCPACRMETSVLSAMMAKIAAGNGDAILCDQFERIVDFNRGKGYCALINMPGPPILSALKLFREDFDHHLHHGGCPGAKV